MRAPFAALFLLAAIASGASAESPTGTWRTPPNEEGAYADVRVAPCAHGQGTLCGVITRVYRSPPGVPDVTGRVIIRDMVESGRRWSGGTVWAPDEDRTYRARLTLQAEGLRVEGCVLGGIICRGQTWKRID